MRDMTERERLIKLLDERIAIQECSFSPDKPLTTDSLAGYLLAHGVIIPPCKVGSAVWLVLEDKFAEGGWFISEEHVTDVGARGIWLSAFDPPKDDHGNFIPWEQIGMDAFTTREEAETELERRTKQ